ncbi:MAG: hypothetical protein SCALA702_20030 [Melioribacteraceae bacterium]|nr:MAG: hypothetical protein SCALA702_20030 [Melioribacteraceae bacterium]
MFSRFKFVFTFLLMLSSIIAAQDLQTVIGKYYDAVGMDKIKEIKSVKTVSDLKQMGMDLVVTEMKKRPSYHKSIAEVNGARIISVYNGITAWMINPMTGSTAPVDVQGEELIRLKYQATIEGLFYAYQKDENVKTEYIGEVKLDNKSYESVKFTLPTGDDVQVFISKETWYIDKVILSQSMGGQKMSSTIKLGNHTKTDGMVFPYSAEVTVNGQPMFSSKVRTIEFNLDIPDSEFSK